MYDRRSGDALCKTRFLISTYSAVTVKPQTEKDSSITPNGRHSDGRRLPTIVPTMNRNRDANLSCRVTGISETGVSFPLGPDLLLPWRHSNVSPRDESRSCGVPHQALP